MMQQTFGYEWETFNYVDISIFERIFLICLKTCIYYELRPSILILLDNNSTKRISQNDEIMTLYTKTWYSQPNYVV